MTDLSIIQLRSNLLQNYKYIEIKQKIITRLSELHLNDNKFRIDSELLVLLCNLIEHLVIKKDGISKKELAVDILKTLYNLSTEEEASISNNIQFIHNNKMIKKVSFYKLFKTSIRELFWKKA